MVPRMACWEPGEATVSLKIDWHHPSILYHHLAEPGARAGGNSKSATPLHGRGSVHGVYLHSYE